MVIFYLGKLNSSRFQQDTEKDNLVTGFSINQNEFEALNHNYCELLSKDDETSDEHFARFLDFSLKFLTGDSHTIDELLMMNYGFQENNFQENIKPGKESKFKPFKASLQSNGFISPHPKTVVFPMDRITKQAVVQQIFKNKSNDDIEKQPSLDHRLTSSKLNLEELKDHIKISSFHKKPMNSLHKSQKTLNMQSMEINNSVAYRSMNPSGQKQKTNRGEPTQTPRIWKNLNALRNGDNDRIDTEYQLSTAKSASNKTTNDNLDYKTAYKVLTQEYIQLFAKYQMLQREFENFGNYDQPIKSTSESIAILTPHMGKNTKTTEQKAQSPVNFSGKRLHTKNKSQETSNRSKNFTRSSANIKENFQTSIQSFRNGKRNASRSSQSHTFKFLNRKNAKNSRLEIPAKQKSGSAFTLPIMQALVKGIGSHHDGKDNAPFPSKDETHEPIIFDNYINPNFKSGRISFKRQMRAIINRLPASNDN